MTRLSPRTIASFRARVYRYFEAHGRRLPWRNKKTTPYQIFVSEVMLQQTQVDRVVDKYRQFVRTFRTFRALADASFASVLACWQGLGYNRRALFLHKSARQVVDEFGGRLPGDPAVIETFPGIGAATAASICAFAFNAPVAFIETNIRSVFIHHFFPGKGAVSDDAIMPLVAQALDRTHPRQWYSALMDYGTYLKSRHPNPSRKSAHYAKQPRFEGSDRQIRGGLLRVLSARAPLNAAQCVKHLGGAESSRVKRILYDLAEEGFVSRQGGRFSISPG